MNRNDAPPGGLAPHAGATDAEPIPVVLTEGTNLAIALSPDGQTIAMDLQGVLWMLPAAGGEARRLTDDFGDIARPQWSPDGARIVFQSYRSGNFHLWTIRPDGSGLTQLTHGEFDCREPRFSPDGLEIAFSSDRTGRYAIHVLNLQSGCVRVLSDTDTDSEASEPNWSPDGRQLVFVRDGVLACVDVSRAEALDHPLIADCWHAGAVIAAPAWTPDGKSLVYRLATGSGRDMRASRLCIDGIALTSDDEEVFPFPVVWLDADQFLYTSDGRIRRRSLARGRLADIPLRVTVSVSRPSYARRWRDFSSHEPRKVKGISFPVLSPNARQVAFGALNQLWLLTIGDPRPSRLTDDVFAKIWPAFSPDGKRLAYVCDRGGNMDIWIRDLAGGEESQLTRAGHALKQCRWSPDGMQIACASQDGFIYRVDASTGRMRREIHQTVWSGRPDWAPDGRHLVLAAIRPYSARFREGRNAILMCELDGGRVHYHPPSPTPGAALDVRNANGPVWIDGPGPRGIGASRLVYTMRGTLWSMPLDAQHRPCAAPVALNDETSDAISASADGRYVLFLSNAQLRLLDLQSGETVDVPLELSWTLHAAPGRTVIHAGRMWDGLSSEAVDDVDIVIERGRIVSIGPHRERAEEGSDMQDSSGEAGHRYIDASAQTVMPGLIDMHTHREMGNQLGAREPRLFLAYGVTCTRGLSDNPYLGLENRESVDAGKRVGPRSFGTGDALDGTRTFWDGMRPIADRGQLERELKRAEALGHDLIKCYVRLPPDLQQLATAGAHAIGIPITSHYLFPAMSFGADGYEHMGGTSRFGYSRTGSTLGRMYQDVLALSAASGCYRTPTLFGLESMLADTPALVRDDVRVDTLFLPGDRAALRRAADSERGQYVPMIASQVEAIMRMSKAGVKIVTGSDFPIVQPGVSLHLNLRAMVRYGMTPVAALRTATSVAGGALHPDLGTVAVGSLADLVFVSGDPTRCIDDAADVKGVMVGGEYHTLESLVDPFVGLEPARVAQAAQHGATPAGAGSGPRLPTPYWWHDARWIECVSAACCGPLMPLMSAGAGMRSRWSSAYRSNER